MDLEARRRKDWRYGCVMDAGSSGTRIYIYRWLDHMSQREKATPEELDSFPLISTKKKWIKKIRPGVSAFADRIESVGPDHLEELFAHARTIIPPDQIPDTPLFLLATAGVRLLPVWERKALLTEICNYAVQNTNFLLPDCKLHIQAITGETEGLYGWIAANYLIGSFDATQKHDHGKNHHTYGFLDMGGASAQIAFVPNATETEKHADDLKLLRMRKLSGQSVEYKVFVTTWLGFGVHQARSRYLEKLVEASGGENVLELPDPCLHRGLTATIDGKEVGSGNAGSGNQPASEKKPYLFGTGKFDECQLQVHPLLSDGKIPCNNAACLLDGHHFPQADFDINHFLGVSEYWHTTHEVFEMGHETKAYDLATYSKRVREYCSEPWDAIKDKLHQHEWGKKIDAEKAISICFRASWVMSVLHDGIGVPRIGLDTSGSGHNATEQLIGGAKDKGFLDPFQAVDDIHDVEVSWTLGKMVLYATSVIPPKGNSAHALPVGFGSNTLKGEVIPADFEYAGSGTNPAKTPSKPHIPTTPPTSPAIGGSVSGIPVPTTGSEPGPEDDSDHWHGALWNNSNSNRRIPGIILFLLIFSFASYLLLGRDRRHRLARKMNLHRLFGGKGRKSTTSSSGILYERIGEDIELGESTTPSFFELADYEDDDVGNGINNDNGNRSGTMRRGVSTSNVKGLGLNLGPYGSRMGSRISSREHLAAVSRSRDTINHIVVFLLPDTQLPPGYAATVYFQWPGRPFQLLGGLSMEKQSAIFRLKSSPQIIPSGTATVAGTSTSDAMADENGFYPTGAENITAQLGISIEPIGQAQQKLMMLPVHLSGLSTSAALPSYGATIVPRDGTSDSNALASRDSAATLTLARRIMKNAFNYLGSFSSGPPGSEVVPMREFQSWWNKFERRLTVDSSFLEKEEEA
ncbi:Golgi apyrase [Orbilia oligospora]|uniref:Golgi apyrase n=1 Tax=Orbilia oligospora TaxID=2813651 RepID=A0A7C8JZV9_ORBOL|nr:Golgi apyrase [Orbilia oligospora]